MFLLNPAPFILFVFLFFISRAIPAAFADTFELRSGKTCEGKVIEEDKAYVYIDLPTGGVVNVPKKDLLSVNGEPYQYSGQGTAPLMPGKPPPYLGAASPEDSEQGNLPQPGKNIPVQFHGIGEDEKSFTAAPAKSSEADRVIHPSGVTEKQLKDYYLAHQEEFRMPVQVRLKFINPLSLKESPGKILRDPSASSAWKDAGWLKKGDTINAPFSVASYDKIYALRKGETLQIHESGGVYLFWVTERKESHILPYEQARPKILNKILTKNLR